MRKLEFWRSGEFLGLFVGTLPPRCVDGEWTQGLTRVAPIDPASDRHATRTTRTDIPAVTRGLLVNDGAFLVRLASDAGHADISQPPGRPRAGAQAGFARSAMVRAVQRF
ncbi:MAG: hypothetical protein OEP48_10750 [Betaproteobacteria bacterium]|nr:hypothetical protein [Betaproteobacteria bacterium]MDH3413291.1 hypothetical protein [Gammaproteobacteria bacterium]